VSCCEVVLEIVGNQIEIETPLELIHGPVEDAALDRVGVQDQQADGDNRHHRESGDSQKSERPPEHHPIVRQVGQASSTSTDSTRPPDQPPIRPNHAGPAAHIANAGYAVALEHRGRGLAKQMCLHSLKRALECGYRAMQFNMVVAANPAARAAWTACGFQIIGTLPEAFNHPRLGFVDAHIMYRMV
jgi:hypothetical protein